MTIAKVESLTAIGRALLLAVIVPAGLMLLALLWLVSAETQPADAQTLDQAGALDPSFNPIVGKQGQVFALAVQPDSKIVIGGVFNSYGGVSRNGIVRVNANGSLDAGFNPGSGFDFGGFDVVNKIAIQPDGKIIVVGAFSQFNGVGRKNILRLNTNGSLDTSFNPGSGPDFELFSLALQPDGKILIGGFFSLYNGVSRRNLARLNSDGSLDTSFDTGTGPDSDVLGIAMQPDGKLVLVGEFVNYNGVRRNYIARVNSNGSLDTSFDTGGSDGASNNIRTLALQPDGRIVIGGLFLQYDGIGRNRIARINADGSLDPTFDPGSGPAGNASNYIASLLLQPDGKSVAAGSFLDFNGLVRPGIVRINSNGSVDPAFNPTSGIGSSGSIDELALQSDGKVLLAGIFSFYDGAPRSGLARANSNGSVDGTFFDLLSPGAIQSISAQPDGRIVIGGSFSNVNGVSRNRLARLNADGSLDNSFNPGSGADSTILDTSLQPDGKIVIGGTFATYNGTARSSIARVNADGSLDTSFNPGTGVAGSFRQVNALVLQTDGKIVLGGLFTSYNGVARSRIARINSNGSLDTSFEPGTGINASSGGTPFVNDLAVQPDGKIVVVGSFLSYNTVVRANFVRINPDGSLDSSFNPGTGPVGITTGLALQPNGKILIGGSFAQYNGISRSGIARINSDGSLDTSFDPGSGTFNVFAITLQPDGRIVMGGLVEAYNGVNKGGLARAYSDGGLDLSFEVGGIDGRVVEIVYLPTGEILVCGEFTEVGGLVRVGIVRLLADSSSPTPTPTPTATPTPGACLDTSFDTDGKVTTDFDSRTEVIEAIGLQADGKIVAVGTSSSDFAVARYNTNGSLDTAFDGDGKVITNFLNTDQGRAVVIQPDGKILVGGTANLASFALARYNTNGSLDTTFDGDGKVTTDFQTGSGTVRIQDLILQSDGKIVAVGGASGNFALARYNTNGSLDTSFGTAGKVLTTFNDQAAALGVAIQSDGKIVAGGGRDNQFPPQGDFVLARYNANGTLDNTFDSDGKTSVSFGPFGAVANDLALQPDGKIVLAGTVRFDLGIARFNSDGSLDTSFGIGGKTMSDFAFTSDQGLAVTLQSNGRIFVIGDGTRNGASDIQLLRLNSNGTVDSSFATGGRLVTDFSTTDTGGSLIVQPDGKLIVAGSALNATRDFALARYNPACLQSPTWEPVVLTSNQVEIKTWILQGRTYAYVKLSFPHDGYRVTSWGQPVNAGSVYSADAVVEQLTGPSVQAVTTTAQIYDLGPLANGNYTFSFRNSGATVKSLSFTVSSVTPPANPIDNAREFVRQQYRDFLNREADQAGEDFWTDNITKCNDPARRPPGQTAAQCRIRQRETTSAAFYLSPEFQYTGYYVYRMFVGGLGREPKLSEFTPDALFVGNGIIVNGQLSAAKINQNKADFAAQFVNCADPARYRCAEFKAIYDGLSNPQYVTRLFTNTGINASASDRTALVNGLNGGTESRASVLRKIVDGINVIAEGNQQFTTSYGQAFYNSQFNQAFVQLEYFGYMKRDPDAAGYAFWLAKLNQFGGDFVKAEMVLAFISSPEYRARFGAP